MKSDNKARLGHAESAADTMDLETALRTEVSAKFVLKLVTGKLFVDTQQKAQVQTRSKFSS